MAELQEGERYGMSWRRGMPDVTVLHVKLTETALRSLESYQGCRDCVTFQPSVQFQGSEGLIKIPKVDLPNEAHAFSFCLSNVGKDNHQGSYDCLQQTESSSGASQRSSLGFIQNKITVCATSDSYQMTRERMVQAEEESRNSAKVIKPGEPSLGRKVQLKKAPQCIPDVVLERKRSTPMNPANTVRKTQTVNVSQHPYRDRVFYLLALKNYKKPELLARLHRDVVNQKDKNSLGIILQQVSTLNPKDNTYALKVYLFKDIQKDWPGYDETDKQSLELILPRKLNSSQNTTSTGHLESPVTSEKDALSTSPQESKKLALPPQILLYQVNKQTTSCEQYIRIVLHEQRQSYEADFGAEYDEYRNLHTQMRSVAEKFRKLDAQRKLLSPGSREYQILEEEILEEYHKLKQSSPSYYEQKYRCEYLHDKLFHIKRLIWEFDQRQAESLH
ncbi:LOW QUALITY PROTEIN: RNA polymerase II elongation factor ELL2-like [Rhynochetos jubatus]